MTIQWTLHPDSTASLDNGYAKSIDLGSTAFALSLIQSEISDGLRSANVRFLRDLHNLNFLSTPQGKLGDLLAAGRCVLRAGDPVGIEYGSLSRSTDRKPWSFFAVRLAKYPPGYWFEAEEPAEVQVFAGAMAEASKAGMPLNAAAAMAKVVEFGNDGDMIRY